MALEPLPSASVRALHASPRVPPLNQFDYSDPAYLRAALLIPLVVLGACLLALLLFNCAWFCLAAPASSSDGKNRRWTAGAYMTFALLALVCAHLKFIGYASINSGLNASIASIGAVEGTLANMSAAADAMRSDAEQVAGNLTVVVDSLQADQFCQAFLPTLLGLNASATQVDESIASAQRALGDSASELQTLSTALDEFGLTGSTVVVSVVYALSVTCLVLLLSVVCTPHESKRCLGALLGVTQAVILVQITVACVLLYGLQIWADFCISPAQVLLNSLSGRARSEAFYLISCSGANPIDASFNKADAFVDSASSIARSANNNALAQVCFANISYINNVFVPLDDTSSNLDKARELSDCAYFSSYWRSVIYDDVCGRVFNGAVSVTLVIYITSALMFIVIIIGAALSKYLEAVASPIEHHQQLVDGRESAAAYQSAEEGKREE